MFLPQSTVLLTRATSPTCGSARFIGIGFCIGFFGFLFYFAVYSGFRRNKLKTKLNSTYTTISGLRTQKTALDAEVATKNKELVEKDLSIVGKDTSIAILNREASTAKTRIEDLETEVEKVEEHFNDSVKQTASLKSELETLTKEVEKLRPRVGEQQDQLRATKQELQKTTDMVKKEKARNVDLARKIAFVTVEAAKRRVARRESKRGILSRTSLKVEPRASVMRTGSRTSRKTANEGISGSLPLS